MANFEGDVVKAQYANFKTSSFNGCFRLLAHKINLEVDIGWMSIDRPIVAQVLNLEALLSHPHKNDLSNPPVRTFPGVIFQK